AIRRQSLARLAVRGVAGDAERVPPSSTGQGCWDWRAQKNHLPGNPAPFLDQVGGRKLSQLPPAPRPIPVYLLMVRAGDQRNLVLDARWPPLESRQVRIVEFSPELVTASLERHGA